MLYYPRFLRYSGIPRGSCTELLCHESGIACSMRSLAYPVERHQHPPHRNHASVGHYCFSSDLILI